MTRTILEARQASLQEWSDLTNALYAQGSVGDRLLV
jgi:hypothetical protein